MGCYGGWVLKREEGIRKVIQLVDDTGIVSARGKNNVRAIMGKGRGYVESTYTMLGPGWSIMRGEMCHDKLACGMDGVGGKIEGLSVDAVLGGEDGVGAIGAHVVEGEFRESKEIRPMGSGE
jgi:hypothetical protein